MAAIADPGRNRPALAVWGSPDDQPPWARPLLLCVATAAGLSYAWGIGNFPLEPFYGAAARSMAMNWRNFFFGAVDPYGTVSLDKLPGAFWVQAAFVRVFGFHYWDVALPQAIAGTLTVLVLYRAVRRLAGPKAGLVAAVIVSASPVSALLNRGNVSDSMLVLLTVLAADATGRAVTTGRFGSLLLAGVWIGLAFQTKMLQAWLILPALFATYLVAAPAPLRRRLGHVVLTGLVAVVVSLSWMSVVAAVPAHDRPYVDGTDDNSIYVQVFVYNGWARVGVRADADRVASAAQPFLTAALRESPDVGTFRITASWDRLLVGPFGRDDGWLLPVAGLAAVGVLVARRRSPRGDPTRAATILWTVWLVVLFSFFSGGSILNSYYTAALVPAIAALCAIGLAVAWRTRISSRTSRVVLLIMVPAAAVYAISLVPAGAGIRGWLIPSTVALSVLGVTALVGSLRKAASWAGGGEIAIGLAVLSLLWVPAVTTGVVVADGLGSFSTPYQSASATNGTTTAPERYQQDGGHLAAIDQRELPGDGIVGIYDTGVLASPLIMITGREYLPIGGYGGGNPSPTLDQIEELVASSHTHWFVIPVSPRGADPRLDWIRRSCSLRSSAPYTSLARLGEYYCS
jgi:4-amino-4-deoxy-L-arabinose transferase-like glycosyltransferase